MAANSSNKLARLSLVQDKARSQVLSTQPPLQTTLDIRTISEVIMSDTNRPNRRSIDPLVIGTLVAEKS